MIFHRDKPQLKDYIIHSAIAVAIIAAILILDLTTKSFVQNNYVSWGGSITVIDGFFYITYVRNTGGAWSLGGGCESFLSVIIVITILVLCALFFIIFFPDKRKPLIFVIALSIISAGTLGNLVDRMAFRYVRDFIKFIIFGYNFPVFNFADVALVCGVILLIVLMCIYFFKPEKKAESSDKAEGGSGVDGSNPTDNKE